MTIATYDTLKPNTPEYEQLALVHPSGFRDYDGRWLFGRQLNLNGARALGLGLGTMLHAHAARRGVSPAIAVGQDYRAYSVSIKHAFISGLMAAGCHVHDIGLATTPMAYFAQFALELPAVAMITASHNANGWTGIKMGFDAPLTFGGREMSKLKTIILEAKGRLRVGGGLTLHPEIAARYRADLTGNRALSRPLRLAVVCGHGAPGPLAVAVFKALGAEVIAVDCVPDHNFPHYNPDPESSEMQAIMRRAVLRHGADLALGFDGDGDRCGVVDDRGEPVYADIMGVLLARELARDHGPYKLLADVKSTGLYRDDPVLKAAGVEAIYARTGHSHMKRGLQRTGALAGFEKSGHYFFGPPLGRGYDDGLLSGILICELLCRNHRSLSRLRRELGRVWSMPTLHLPCADERKYQVVEAVTDRYRALRRQKGEVAGQRIRALMTLDGVRITLADGTWGLLRASSNTPQLVIVCESPVSEERRAAILSDIEARLARHMP